jgi:DNA-directed RNA polymerase specialized sigma24 family protein
MQERRQAGGERDSRRDAEFTEHVSARAAELRRVAYLLCQDWHHADDLVQNAITRLYLNWSRARAVQHLAAYARVVTGSLSTPIRLPSYRGVPSLWITP